MVYGLWFKSLWFTITMNFELIPDFADINFCWLLSHYLVIANYFEGTSFKIHWIKCEEKRF